jgi:hypothetical protein
MKGGIEAKLVCSNKQVCAFILTFIVFVLCRASLILLESIKIKVVDKR